MIFVLKLVKISVFLKEIQNLPEQKRKIIRWAIVIIISLGLFFWWIQILKQNLGGFGKEGMRNWLGIPQLQEKLKDIPKTEMPKFEIPGISEEELKKIEEEIKKEELNK